MNYLKNWRPLSLINCDGKVYAKMLARRMEKVSGYLLHTDQAGFQKGWSIHDNLMDLMSIIDLAEDKVTDLLLFSFDFQKAFDNVNLIYLDKVLQFFGFGDNLRQMVKSLHEEAVSCTINGGHSSKYMKIKNGLRQGSPLSPVLFNLAVEVLALSLRQNKDIEGLKVGGVHKKLGQYADDMWTICKGNKTACKNLLNTFDEFAEISGLKINYDKSQVLPLGSLRNTDFELTMITDKPLQVVTQLRVLGIWVSANKGEMINKNYTELI